MSGVFGVSRPGFSLQGGRSKARGSLLQGPSNYQYHVEDAIQLTC